MATPSYKHLLALLEEQQARIDRLEAAAAGATLEPDPRLTTRRGMLKTAAVGAAGFAGALLVEPATASASAPASFTSKTARPAVTATNKSGKGRAIASHTKGPEALWGGNASASPAAAAVHGEITPANGAGTGVIGTSPVGTGVAGTSGSGVGVAGASAATTGGVGVQGQITGTNGLGTGVAGKSPAGTGVAGTSDKGMGVTGTTASAASGAVGVQGTVSSSGPGGYSAGVYGQNNGTSGSGIGVYGAQNGFGWGVYGTTPSGSGVYGYSSAGYGVQAGSSSGTGAYVSSTSGIGVDAHSSSAIAVAGTSGNSTGVQGSSSSGYGVYGSSPNNYAVVGVTTSGNAVYGQVSTVNQAGVVGRTLDASGNWAIYGFGNIGASGTKSAIVPAKDGKGHMTLYCMESPECWFEDFGSARLSNGSVRVKLDPEFAQTVETGEYHVFVQAEGDCKGLSVLSRTKSGFVVQELAGGRSNVPFAFRIVALRKDVSAPRLRRVILPEAEHVKLHVAN
jgi:hypothetical protein